MATHRPILTLGPNDNGRVVSADEFAEADYVEPWIYERVDGRLVVMSPEGRRHVADTRPWRKALSAYWAEHPDFVEDFVVQAWLRVDEGTDRIGDIGVYLVGDASLAPVPDRAPDIMLEAVSPGAESRDRDYVRKRVDYHKQRVREYVIINGEEEQVVVLS
jgi:Uma2 family endonuclease